MEPPNEPPLKKRRKEHKYREKTKSKVHGVEHTRHRKTAVVVPARKIGPDCRCSRLKCYQTVNDEMRKHIFEQFYSYYTTKDEQDAYLTGLISMHPVVKRRHRVEVHIVTENGDLEAIGGKAPNAASFSYKVRFKDEDIPVCATAFINIHGVTRERIRRLQQILVNHGHSPRDGRGKQTENYYQKTPEAVIQLIRHHISSLQKYQSHYSLRQNPNRYYLHENLTSITEVHELFLKEYQIRVSYAVHRKIFSEYNIGFALPKSDTCKTCDEIDHKIIMSVCNEDKQKLQEEKRVHLTSVARFRKLHKMYTSRALQGRINMLSFDYMQNLPLPNIQTSDVFYLSQLWTYVFGIHNFSNNAVRVYAYDETHGGKGSNNVTSMLFDYFRKLPYCPLVLICDNCTGQNKNKTFVRLLYLVVHYFKMFPKVTVLFPIRGYTYLANDRDFACIGRKKKTLAAEVPEDWYEHIRAARKQPSPFECTVMEYDDFFNVDKSIEKFFLKTPVPAMQLKRTRMLEIKASTPDVKVRRTSTGQWMHIRIRNKTKLPREITFLPLYDSQLQLDARKLKNMMHLSKFLKNSSSMPFYDRLTRIGNNDDDFEYEDCVILLDDDNSSADEA